MSSSHNARTNTPIRSNFYRPIFYPNSLSHLLTRILTISIDVLCVQNTWKSAWRRRHGEAVVRSVSFARRSRVDAWRDDRQRRCSQRWNYCRVWTERHTEWCRPPWRRCRSNVILQPSQHKVTRDRRVWYDARHPFCIISGVVGQKSRTALPYLTFGAEPARKIPSAEATARAQCASPTDLKVDRTSLKLWQTSGEEANGCHSRRSSRSSLRGGGKTARGHKWHGRSE